jgi:hypothetical protein
MRGPVKRRNKDLLDIVELARVNGIDLSTSNEFIALLNRYELADVYFGLPKGSRQITTEPASNELDFELPDAPDFFSEPPRLTFEQYVSWVEGTLSYHTMHSHLEKHRTEARCNVEFVL